VFEEILGIPAHPLLIHAAVIFIPLQVAAAIVRCARRPRPEVFPYPASRVLVGLNAVAPGFIDWWAARAARKAGRV